jgi:hypothetical protein
LPVCCRFCDLTENFCTIPRAADFAYNHCRFGTLEYLFGGEMHWIKLALEGWFFLGVTTTVCGIFWTSKEGSKLDALNTATPAKMRPDFGAKQLSEARSA